MLADLRHMPAGKLLEADVCIAGAGAAGITLARELRASGLSVCLLEAGDADFDRATQSLYEGRDTGMPYYPLVDARLRFFGGTTNIWGGRCVPLDDIDFETRDWVPHSGWPICAPDLAPYYRRAQALMELGEFEYGERLWSMLGQACPPFDRSLLLTQFWRFDEREEPFGYDRCQDLLLTDDVTVILHANVVHLQLDPGGRTLQHVDISTIEGKRGRIAARAFVLACGGIENPRLLLAARDVVPTGIGNQHDQVGRYFMEHPHARLATSAAGEGAEIWTQFRKRFVPGIVPVAPALLPAPALQRQRRILNTAMTFKMQSNPNRGVPLDTRLYMHLKHKLDPTRSGRNLWQAFRRFRNWVYHHVLPTAEVWRARLNITGLSLIARAEQAPNPASRVLLSEETDALGMPRLKMHWQLTELDKHTLTVLAEIAAGEFRRLGYPMLERSPWLAEPGLAWPADPTVSNHPIGGYHHMGTTRMSSSPRTGVVDSNCRVHGCDNLYIAGSSVFPTSGWANPTLTILALCARLAEHIRLQLRQGERPRSAAA